ncbi:hypothetical protein LDENG_00176610, partial [Lucifuga dentata]
SSGILSQVQRVWHRTFSPADSSCGSERPQSSSAGGGSGPVRPSRHYKCGIKNNFSLFEKLRNHEVSKCKTPEMPG